MRKLWLILGIMHVLTGCSFTNTKEANQKTKVSETVVKNSKEKLDTEKGKNIEDDIDFVSDDADEWCEILAEDGKLIADFNQDGYDDCIQIEYKIKEGSQAISKFELSLSGINKPFIIEKYDVSFVKLEVIDIDGDNSDEILLLFDTHGEGGQGTHDLYMVKILDDALVGTMLDEYVEGTAEIDKSWHVDGIYRIEKVLYKDTHWLIVHQYVWGEQGHSDDKRGYRFLDKSGELTKLRNLFLVPYKCKC